MSETQDEAAPADGRPCYRIAVFGLADRSEQLLEVVKHAGSNDYRYQIADGDNPGEFDIALVDMTVPGGAGLARTLKSVPHQLPVIGVGRRSNRRSGNDDLLLATFSLDVLGVLNKAAQSLSTRARRPSSYLVQAGGHLHLPQVSGRPPRALVIEPSPAIRSELAAALRQIGVDAEGVGTIVQAEDVLRMRTYELVILEPRQPDGDGLSMLRRLRHGSGSRKLVIPVIVLSSRSGLFDLIKAAWAGCNGYLGKPVALSSLHSTVSRVLLRSLRSRLNAERKLTGREPSQPVASQPVHSKQAPLQQAPLQRAPLHQAPLQQVPLQQMPLQSTPLQSMPLQSMPLQPVTSQPVTLPERSPEPESPGAETLWGRADPRMATPASEAAPELPQPFPQPTPVDSRRERADLSL